MNRRKMIQGMAAAGALGFGLPSTNAFANVSKQTSKTKRVIFFLQNNGFNPNTCLPKDIFDPKTSLNKKNTESCSLSEFKLQEHMKDLEPYKDKMHVITGVHGVHCNPGHSAFIGALGGYFGNETSAPAGPTIDHAISQHLPNTIIPHLCIGFEDLGHMKSLPTKATLSASGANKPIFMQSNPNLLYQSIFGSIADGDLKDAYNIRSNILEKMEDYESTIAKGLTKNDRLHHSNYVDYLNRMNISRKQLAAMPEALKKYAPKYDEGYTHPEFETDWHDRLLDIGIAALQANLTNVLTIGSGRGGTSGSWEGVGVKGRDHGLGHLNQVENEWWVKIRQYNCRMLVKLMKSLESIPEDGGTMMDNTLIVYTSDCGDYQHTSGKNWPFVLLGNGGGSFKTGAYTKVNGRPINDLYATFLHGVGAPVDRFNMDASRAGKLKSKLGPIESILA